MGLDNEREEQAVRRLTDRLIDTFADTHSADEIETLVATSHHIFDGHAVRDFVPILLERMVRRSLANGSAAAPQPTGLGAPAGAGTLPAVPPTEGAATYEIAVPSAPRHAAPSAPRVPRHAAPEPDETETQTETIESGAVAPPPDTIEAELVWSHSIAPQSPDEAAADPDWPLTMPGDSAPRNPWLSPKRLVPLLVAAVVLIVAIVVGANMGGSSAPKPTAAAPAQAPQPVTVVHGAIGSEKMPFFADPQVIAAFARHGLKVQVEAAGSRQIATSLDLDKYDFVFPSSEQAAERIMRQRPGTTTKYSPFSSPMAIATFRPIVDVLTKAGVVRPGPVPTFDVAAFLSLVGNYTRWDDLPGNTIYPAHKDILVSTTDPRSSNSAAMYLAVASFVANGDLVVQGPTQVQNVLPTVARLFVGQGYTENSSAGPFQQYMSDGIGVTPMVWIYEAQFVDASAHGQLNPNMVMMYPSPTVLSKHTLVPLTATGDKVGQLLTTDPTLQRLAAEHGFRTGDPTQFASVVADHHVPVSPNLIDVVETPTYDTLEQLLNGVSKSYN